MSTITREFTKEQLIARINQVMAINKFRIKRDPEADGLAMDNELFAIALASLEAEAVYQVYGNSDDTWSDVDEEEMIRLSSDGDDTRTLYTAPPAPVSVPEKLPCDLENEWSLVDTANKNNSIPDEKIKGDDFELNGPLSCYQAGKIDGWNNYRAAMLQSFGNSEQLNSPVIQDCSCRTCRPVTMTDMRFVVCHECGNKRCPHANDHRNACTGSNEPGQEGSAYPAAPQQEVK